VIFEQERAVFGTICTVAGKAGVKLFTSSGYEPYLASKANPFTSEILPSPFLPVGNQAIDSPCVNVMGPILTLSLLSPEASLATLCFLS